MPGKNDNGPITRRQSKRKPTAVAEGAAGPAEECASKRIKTEPTVQEQLQSEDIPGAAGESEVAAVDNVDNVDPEPEPLPTRPANTGELLNQYLMSRLDSISTLSEAFNEEFLNEAKSRFGWMEAEEDVIWPLSTFTFTEWEQSYALDKQVAHLRSHNQNYKVKTSKDAQHAVRAIERCKQSRDKIIDDEAFIRRWKRRWQKEIMPQTEAMFNHILQPLAQHRRTLETTGHVLGNEIAGYARRQSM